MRKHIVAGNWKMNKTASETEALISTLQHYHTVSDVEIMVAPTFVNLQSAVSQLNNSNIEVIAQNMHFADNGAFTGEISAAMLKSVGVTTVILGHSERRAYHHETDALITKKVQQAMAHNMRVIFCFGEELTDRQSERHKIVVKNQIKNALFQLSANDFKSVVLAYEPVWAIGTGETATPEQAQEMHSFIRKTLLEQYGEDVANTTSILYGGSVKPNNAEAIFSKPDVDGGLIGGAALNAEDFYAIVKACHHVMV